MKVRPVCIEAGDAVELVELLGFLDHCFASDPRLASALDRFVGGGYEAKQLRADLLRFDRLVGDVETHAAGGGR